NAQGVSDRTMDVHVARNLTAESIECGWSNNEDCSFAKGRLRMSGREVHVRFNNSLRTSGGALAKHVQITPAVRNLRVDTYAWEGGDVFLRGDFTPSSTYDVTISGLVDRLGGKLSSPVHFTVETRPVGASVAMGEGLVML